MAFRSSVLDRKYSFEYDLGLWSYGIIQVIKDRHTNELKLCRAVTKDLVRIPDAVSKLSQLRSLQHENICQVTDVLEDASRIYIVSDRCHGGDVQDWMVRVQEEGNWMQERTVAEYIRQTLIALVHLHGNRQCHRDLRPSSLALTSKLPDAKVKLYDCGLAEILDPLDEVRREFSPYGAPEVLAGRGYPGRAPPSMPSDLWSVGAIAHQLLVGSAPPRLEDDNTFLVALARAGTQALAGNGGGDVWSERSSMSRDFVKQLLRPNPAERPTAAAALHHPWMLSCSRLDNLWQWSSGASESVSEMRNRLLSYVLAVLLLPDVLKQRDVYQLRSAFATVDTDGDGFISKVVAQRLMKDYLTAVMPIDIATLLDVADVAHTGAVNLCMFLVCFTLGRMFGAPEGTGKAQKTALLVRKLLKSFFECFGDAQRMVASADSMSSKLKAPVVREVEKYAGIRYEELVSSLPGDGAFNAEALTTSILEGGGRGTPLAPADLDTTQEEETEGACGEALGLEVLQELVRTVFQTCALHSGQRPRGVQGSILPKFGEQ